MSPANAEAVGSIRKKFKSYDLTNNISIVFLAHRGVKPTAFYAFSDAVKMTEKNLAELLHIHPRTMSNYRDQKKSLAPVESEHLLKLIALFAKGEEILGSIDEFNYWLQKPGWNSKELPIQLLITPGGVDMVSDELDRLAYGYAI